MINITVDLGNYNIKYLGESKGMFSSRYDTKFNPNIEMFERIEFNGETTCIGIGEYEREFNKANKNYLPQLFYAINKATNESDVNLCLLLPIGQMPNKKKIIDELKEKAFTYAINGKNKVVNINKVAILPEGFVSFYAFEETNEDTLIIDIGSRTINYSSFIQGKVEKSFTEKLGVLDLYTNIKEIENAAGGDYIEEDIERLVNMGKINVDSKVYLDFFKDILNRTKTRVNIKNYRVCFTGGGALLLKSFIEANTPGIVHSDAVYANVLGAHKLAGVVWKGAK